jgi:hypothetical protein
LDLPSKTVSDEIKKYLGDDWEKFFDLVENTYKEKPVETTQTKDVSFKIRSMKEEDRPDGKHRYTIYIGGSNKPGKDGRARGNEDLRALANELLKCCDNPRGAVLNLYKSPPKPEKGLNYPYYYGFVAPTQEPPGAPEVSGGPADYQQKAAKVNEEMAKP